MSITSTRQIEATPKVQWIERWAPIAGLVFVALMVVGSSLVGQVPLPDASEREILDYLADGDAHTRNLIGSYLWVFGSLTFLWFLTRLRSDLRRAEGGTGPLTNLAFSAGLVFAAVWMVAAAVSAALANAIAVRGASISDPDLVRVLPPTGRLLLLQGAGLAGAACVLVASVVILRTRVYPRWLAGLGIVAAIALLFDLIYLNITPFWAWVGIASVVMLVRHPATATTADSAERRYAGHDS